MHFLENSDYRDPQARKNLCNQLVCHQFKAFSWDFNGRNQASSYGDKWVWISG